MLREPVYNALADSGSLTTLSISIPVDERYETDRFVTYKSILEKVSANMGVKINFKLDKAIEKFLDDFNALPEAKRRQLGVWE